MSSAAIIAVKSSKRVPSVLFLLRQTAHLRRPIAPPVFVPEPGCKTRQQRRSLSSTQNLGMATDEDYMAFLNKANQDADDARAASAAATTRPAEFKATDEGSEVPKVIRDVCRDAVYVSEADEPFEGVSLKWSGEGGLPDEVEFAKLIHHWDAGSAEIDIMDPLDWDSRGQYTKVIEAVREASRGNDVRVYRVTRDKSRVEYWVITREDAEGRIVGAKALGVES